MREGNENCKCKENRDSLSHLMLSFTTILSHYANVSVKQRLSYKVKVIYMQWKKIENKQYPENMNIDEGRGTPETDGNQLQ